MTPLDQRNTFIAHFSDDVAATAHAVLHKMRDRLPGAIELVYDNYNALAIGFSPTERVGDIIFSIALYPRWVSLFFFNGVVLPDPENRLKGSGKGVRHIVLTKPEVLDEPAVKALMNECLSRAKVPLDPAQEWRVVIKSISPKQRPRRPAGG